MRGQSLFEQWSALCQKGFLMVPNGMLRDHLDLDPYAHRVLLTLMSWVIDPEEPATRPRGRPIRVSNLVEWTNIGQATVRRSLITLEKAGLVRVTRERGMPNEYTVNYEGLIALLK